MTKGELIDALVKKYGFERYRKGKRGSHEPYTLRIGGKKVATTRFSRQSHSYNIGKPLLRRIAVQLRLKSLETLLRMVACSCSKEEYLEILKAGGHLD